MNKPELTHKFVRRKDTTYCGKNRYEVKSKGHWNLVTCPDCLRYKGYYTIKYKEVVENYKIQEPVDIKDVDIKKLDKFFN